MIRAALRSLRFLIAVAIMSGIAGRSLYRFFFGIGFAGEDRERAWSRPGS